MLAAKLPRLETVEVVEEEMPTPGKGEVLIRMKASALCRSDLHRYHGTTILMKKMRNQLILHQDMNHVELLKRLEKALQK